MKKKISSLLLLLIMAIAMQAQEITVHGNVTSATDGEPLIGASIVSTVQESLGTITDLDGNFVITVPEGSSLSISYIGFVSTTVKAAPQVTVQLKEDLETLNEVVVVGYFICTTAGYKCVAVPIGLVVYPSFIFKEATFINDCSLNITGRI